MPTYFEGVKKALGFDPEYNAKMQAMKERQAQHQAAQKPMPTPVPRSNLTQYAGGDVLKRRMAAIDEAGYANGGMVRGKGTGTSDSIHKTVPEGTYIMPADSTKAIGARGLAGLGKKVPVALSNGEYELPPEQVHAIGVQALDQIKNATHTPVARGLPGYTPQNQEPRQFFASGGAVDDMSRWKAASDALRQSNDRIAASQGRVNMQAPDGRFDEAKLAQAANMVQQSRLRMGTQAPVSNPNGSMNMQRVAALSNMVADSRARGLDPEAARQYRENKAIAMASNDPNRPRGFPVHQPRQYLADGGGVFDKVKKWDILAPTFQGQRDIQDNYQRLSSQGKTAQAIGGVIGDATKATLAQSVAPLAEAGRVGLELGKGLFGIEDNAPSSVAASQKAVSPEPVESTKAAPPASAAPPSTPTGQSASVAAAQSVGATDVPASGQQIAPGIYKHGANQFSDNANGMGFDNGFTGRPSAQTMAAIDGLAARNGSAPVASSAVRGLPSFDPSTIQHSGNSWEARNNLRNLQVGMNSMRSTNASRAAGLAAYKSALDADARARGAENEAGITAMRENAAIARQGMQEQGANFRDANRNALEAQRLGQAAQESAFSRGVKGFDIQAAQRRQQIQSMMDAATTPEERKAIAERFPDVYGRDSKTKMQFDVIRGKNDPITGAYSGDYAVAFDPETGTIRRMDIGGASQPDIPIPQAASERVVGTIYTAPNGQKVKWDGKGLLPV